MLFVHQVIASPESHQMGIVSWCWDGHWPGAAHISVTKLVGKDLQFIWWEVVVVPEHVIVRRPAGSLSGSKADVRYNGLFLTHNLLSLENTVEDAFINTSYPTWLLPECQHDCKGRSQTLMGELFWCPLWCPPECCRSSQPIKKYPWKCLLSWNWLSALWPNKPTLLWNLPSWWI